MDFDENIPHISPIVPTTQIRDISSNQTQRLLDRLLQELDDENTDLDNLGKIFKELSIKSNIDYDVWSQKDMSVSLETGNITKYEQKTSLNNSSLSPSSSSSSSSLPIPQPMETSSTKSSSSSSSGINDSDLLEQLNQKNRKHDSNGQEFDNAKRSLILSLLHREKKLSRHYESLITVYENLITYTAMNVRERREQNYGLYTNDENLDNVMNENSSNKNQTPMNTIQSIQISQSLIARAQSLKKNTELLQALARQKRSDLDLVRSLIAAEAQELATILEQEDEDEVIDIDIEE
ncbi:hypothetical protein C6P40_005260 [Pichia californica]|uniref:Uncharacterized protein n=1 Tax=Pichia californica TaxID=460514 RepID=A0A9P7BGX6_9ASCO|nr:hypothetical protein C6P42_005478 [[Candida] californica]KAG0689284.1 hypothetical protein C6P40_005260 [[Candida] californica]